MRTGGQKTSSSIMLFLENTVVPEDVVFTGEKAPNLVKNTTEELKHGKEVNIEAND